MIRTVFIVLASASIFLFPWPYAAVLVFIGALYVPMIGVSLGVIYDALYWTHGIGWPIATTAGALGSLAAFFLARFIRTRVSDISL